MKTPRFTKCKKCGAEIKNRDSDEATDAYDHQCEADSILEPPGEAAEPLRDGADNLRDKDDMEGEQDPRDKLQSWHRRLLHIYNEKHPLILLARASVESGDRTIMQQAIEAIASDQRLRRQLCGPAKQELVERYGRYNPAPFWQLEGWHEERYQYMDTYDYAEDYEPPDQEGHRITSRRSWQLMEGNGVYVLVGMDTPREQVVPLMQKLAARITNEYSQPPREISDEDAFPF